MPITATQVAPGVRVRFDRTMYAQPCHKTGAGTLTGRTRDSEPEWPRAEVVYATCSHVRWPLLDILAVTGGTAVPAAPRPAGKDTP